MNNENVKLRIRNILDGFGLKPKKYLELLEDFEENFNEIIILAKKSIDDLNQIKSLECILSIKGLSGNLGLENTYIKSKDFIQSLKKNIDEKSLTNLEELQIIFNQEIYKIRTNNIILSKQS
ncbi:MAG: hypothetical protein COA79_06005 [Planctomycetota bacterium]|nr:MAG: hypothetical protein COA79_06005 [Planctomycetota bacterium]